MDGATSWAWGDLDRDGFSDIVVRKHGGGVESHLVAFRGLAASAPPYWAAAPDLLSGISEPVHSAGVVIADLDGDGAPNIITLSLREPGAPELQLLYWRKNSAGAWFADSTIFETIETTESTLFSNDPHFADIDGDDDLDMVIGREARFGELGVQFFENIGTPDLPIWQQDSSRVAFVNQNPPGFVSWSPVFVHANEDTLLDLLLVFEIESAISVAVYPGIADTAGLRWGGNIEALFGHNFDAGPQQLLPFDVNQDGHSDLLILEGSRTGRVYLTADSATFDRQNYFRVGPVRFQFTASALALNHDSDFEKELLAVGHFASFFNDITTFQSYKKDTLLGMELWRQTGWFSPPEQFNIVLRFKYQITDIDNNDQPNFAVTTDMHFFQAYENSDANLQGTWKPSNELIAPFNNRHLQRDTLYFDPSFADLDRDDDVDLLVAARFFAGPDSGKTQYRFFENDLRQQGVVWHERPDWLSGLDTDVLFLSTFSDLDLDGDQDLIIGNNAGKLVYFENVGSALRPSWQLIPDVFTDMDVFSNAAPTFADFDGDGRPDLFIGNQYGQLLYFRNESIVSVEERSGRQPSSFGLLQNYPNPFNPATTITYEISNAGLVQLTIYNIRGQIVKKMVETVQGAGSYNVVWDGTADAGLPAASGVYVYELRLHKQLVERKKMVLIH